MVAPFDLWWLHVVNHWRLILQIFFKWKSSSEPLYSPRNKGSEFCLKSRPCKGFTKLRCNINWGLFLLLSCLPVSWLHLHMFFDLQINYSPLCSRSYVFMIINQRIACFYVFKIVLLHYIITPIESEDLQLVKGISHNFFFQNSPSNFGLANIPFVHGNISLTFF